MARYLISSDQPVMDQRLLGMGAILIGAGAVLGLAGSAFWGAAVVSALRRHVRASGMPPSELAMHHWRRAKTAAQAGAETWRGQVPVPAQRQKTAVRMG
jgi:hypothetical protein